MVISVQLIVYALTLFIALGIIFIGVRKCFQSSVAARQFGVPLVAPADRDFLAIKAGRDIASGVVVPVFRHAEWTFKPAILVHWVMAAVMLAIVEPLRSGM